MNHSPETPCIGSPCIKWVLDIAHI